LGADIQRLCQLESRPLTPLEQKLQDILFRGSLLSLHHHKKILI